MHSQGPGIGIESQTANPFCQLNTLDTDIYEFPADFWHYENKMWLDFANCLRCK